MKIPIHSGDERPEAAQEPLPASEVPESAPEATADPAVAPATEEPAPADRDVDVRVQELEAALAIKTQEYEAAREQLLRLMADFDNYRKRMTRQHEEARQFATADLVIALLPGLDNLERALSAAAQDLAPSSAMIVEGVSMVLRQFKEALSKVGVREVQTQGLAFDPTRHEAVDIVSVPASEDGLIMEEVQHGYLLHERLLRPARVVVGRAERDDNPGGA
jgi:molecular chaperone GrpE